VSIDWAFTIRLVGSEPLTGSDLLKKMEPFDLCLHDKGESSCLRDGAMAKSESLAVLRDIHTLFHVGSSNSLTDAQLLDRFRARSDLSSSEAAFAGLMARHGPMVLGVCRRALRNPDDVADAFQATFLILVRKADTVRVEDSLGRWLYGVSRRVSVRAKLAVARRSAREVREIELAAAPAADADLAEVRDVLDEEIGRLPEKFRSAVVLCELVGCGHDEAARQLGCAVGTVKSRLSRAREKLRSRLIRRGVAPLAWALVVESTRAAVPAELIETTVKAAVGYADWVVSPAVTLLTQGVLRAMLLKKVSMIAITVVASLALATSAGVWARQAATLPAGDQPEGLLTQKEVGVENESGKTARSTDTDLGESKEQEDRSIDRYELLRLDVELLAAELLARKTRIERTNNQLIATQIDGKSEGKQAQIESLQRNLEGFRKDYIAKMKERSQKQSELEEIQMTQVQENNRRAAELKAKRRARMEERGASTKMPLPNQPAASDAPRISPVLEERLSGIERKLDNVLRAIEDLKRERRQ
jgi:RNA polymerase sigma factor (sigma-70 family)